MKKGQKRKAPWLRALAIMLAMSMLMTSSGFQVLAQEASTEISAEQAAAEQARIAAEQAAAAQAAAAEAAAEQARIAAEQAAAEQARIAAEQAAKAQSEAESEAARIAAEQAAAAQAAAESEAARIAAEQAAAESEAARIAAEQAAKAQSEAESEAARIAAEEAAKAQSEAESEAARIAAEQAQAESQAAAEAAAAAESEAARIAAEQAQAESQQASEEAAAAQAAAEAAAAQAAADAETARKQQEAAAQNKKQPSKEAKSEESEPIEGGKLVLKMDAASTQEEGEYAKIKAEYGLGENSPIEEVETRLYIWSDTAELPQFDENNQYQDPTSKRIFLLKRDSEGDRYVEYMLKAGESFKQEFLFADSSAEDGATVTFELSFGAEGEVPTDFEVPEKKSVVTYTLPEAEETETEVPNETVVETEAPAETEAPVQTEAETVVTEAPAETEAPVVTEAPTEAETPEATEATEAPAETEAVTEAVIEETEVPTETEAATEEVTESAVVENIVTFEVAEGAAVTVDGVDVTNATALAKDGTIYFTVTVLEGFELAEVLVDGSIPARTTENAGEYIIENIKTDATVVAVTTAAVETESETEGVEQLLMMMNLEVQDTAQTLNEAENDNEYTDLTQFLTDVEIMVAGEPYVPDTEIADNSSFSLKISFAENSALEKQFPANGKLKYAINQSDAKYIKALDNYTDLPLYKAGSQTTIGKFSVDTATGTVYVDLDTWDESINSTNKNPIEYYLNYSVWLEFSAKFNAREITDYEEISIDFGNGIIKNINFEKANPVSGEKKVSAYDPETGEFTFIIKVTADRAADNVKFTDTLGPNLVLTQGSVRYLVNTDTEKNYQTENELSAATIFANYATAKSLSLTSSSSNQFSGELNGLNAGDEYYIMYKAALKDGVAETVDGDVQGLENTVAFTVNNQYTFEASKPAQHTIDWVQKNTPVIENGKLKWTIVVNEGGMHNASGIIVKDTLSGGGVYDTDTPIKVTKTKAGAAEASTTTINWSNLNELEQTDTKQTWTYIIPEELENYEYVFEYYSFFEIGTDPVTHVNDVVVDVDDNLYTDASNAEIPGTGEGTGEGIGKNVFKKFEGFVADTPYAEWSARIIVPVGGLENVIFTDNLTGSHSLPSDLGKDAEYGIKIYKDDTLLQNYPNIDRISDKTFKIIFGNTLTNDSNKSYDIDIVYYTIVDTTAVGKLGNTVKVTSDLVNQLASDETEIQQYKIYKEKVGEISDDGIITWRVEIDQDGIGFIGDEITVVDTVSDNHEYVDNSAKVKIGVTSVAISEPVKSAGEEGKVKYTFTIPLLSDYTGENAKGMYVLTYQTEIIDYAERKEAITVTNDVKVYSNGRDVGGDSVSFGVANTMITKEGLMMPGTDTADEKEPNKAVYQIVVNPEKVSLEGPDGQPVNSFVVTDISSPAVQIDRTTVKVYQDAKNTLYTNRNVYFEDGKGEKENTLVITINDPGAHSYIIEYNAYVRKPETVPDDVEFENYAYLTADTTYTTEVVKGEMTFEKEGGGGGDYSRVYVRVLKDDDKTGEPLGNAHFEVSRWTGTGWQSILTRSTCNNTNGNQTTGESYGEMIIGQYPTGVNNLTQGGVLAKDVLYKVEEISAPDGYLKSDAAYYFVLDTTELNSSRNGFKNLVLPSDVAFDTVEQLANGQSGIITISNTKITDVEATKTWVDDNDRDGIRPEIIEVTLKIKDSKGQLSDAVLLDETGLTVNGVEQTTVTKTVTLTAPSSGNVWKVKWTNLPELDAKGNKITYVIEETLAADSGYTLTAGEKSLHLTNTHVPETVTKSVKKVWADSNNNDGKRPANIQLTLQYSTDGVNYSDIDQNWLDQYNNTSDKKIQYKTNNDSWKNLTASTAGTATVTVSGNITADEWTCRWQNLPKYQKGGHGTEFTYRVKEEPLTTAAGVTYTVSPSNGIVVLDNDDTTIKTITNSYETVNIKKKFVKIWDDSGNLFGTRPESIDVILTATVPGKSYTLPNEIEAEKTLTVNDVHPNNPNEWIVTWENLPKYYEGVEIQYSIDEVNAGEGYVPANLTTDGADGDYGLITLTNTLTNEKSVELEKIWSDGNNRDGKRPESIVIELTAKNSDDKAVEINGEFFTKYASSAVVTVNGVNSTYNNTNGNVTLTASDDNSWTMKWEHLPAKIGGKSITYSLDEVSVPSGYTKVDPTESNGKFTVTNYYAPKVEDVTVTKEWIGDNQNIDGNRPTSVKLKLMVQGKKADGTLVGTRSAVTAEFADIYKYTAPVLDANEVKAYVLVGDSTTATAITSTGEITVRGNATADRWTCTWKNLPDKIFVEVDGETQAFDAVYTVVETSDSQFYKESVEGFTVKNTYEEILTDKEVTKRWEDSNNKFQNRPSDVTLQLYYKVGTANAEEVNVAFIEKYNTGRASGKDIQVEVNGEKAATATGSVTISGDATDASWNCEWLNLPKYINGKEVVYSVRETSELTNNYTSSASSTNATFADDKATITNTYTEQKGKLKLTKNWADNNNHYGVRPNSITVKLSYKYATDTEFKELDSDFVTTYLTNDDAIVTSSTVTLAEVSGQPGQYTLSVSDANVLGKWEAEWYKLPLEINKQNVIWKVEEVGNVDNYTISQPADNAVLSLPNKEATAVITNTYDYDTVNIDITKVWDDNGNAEGSRPKSVKVKLTAVVDGNSYPVTENFGVTGHQVQIEFNEEGTYSNYTSANGEITINVPDDDEWNSSETWSCSVINLPKKWHGNAVTYQIQEIKVPEGYTASPNVATDISDNGTATITNTKGRETTEITIIKEWQDHNNVDGYRPDEITVELYADGSLKETTTIKAAEDVVEGNPNLWSYTWENLEKWRNDGKGNKVAIDYSVKEVTTYKNSDKYTSGTAELVDGDASRPEIARTYKITNSREWDKISVNGIKIWHDDGEGRPTSIVLALYKRSKDGTETYVGEKTVSGASNIWSCFWTDLPKNDANGEITYFIKEKAVTEGDLADYYFIPNKDDEMVVANIKTGAEISKKAVTGEELKGAVLQILDETGETVEVVAEWTSSDKPHKIGPKVLYPGKQYTLHEVSAPAGYHLAEDVKFTVNSDGSITKVEMKDEPTKIQLSKVEITGQAELPNAQLQVLDEEGNVVDEWVSGYTPHVIEGILEVGKTYYFRETLAPDGYAIADDVPFVVEGDRGETQEVKMEDAVTSFTVEKLNGESFVEGAELVIWKNDAAYAAYLEGKGTPTVATDYIGSNDVRWTSDGTAHTVAGLKPGSYVLHEISAPAGYTLAADIPFVLNANGTVEGIDIKITNNVIEMYDNTTELVVSKKAILGDETVNLVGAELVIYVADETGAKTNEVAKAFRKSGPQKAATASVECEWITGDEEVYWIGIPAGNYVLVEKSAPAGYKLADDIPFVIHEDGSITCGENTVDAITMMNERTELTVSKKAVTGADELQGATLAIYAVDADGKRTLAQVYDVDATGAVVDVEDDGCIWTSGETQKTWTGIPAGKYVLVEEVAPEGYTRAQDIYFEIEEDGTVVSENLEDNVLTMRDKLTEIKIHKLAEDTTELLAGAKLQILNEKGTVCDEWTSGEEEHVITGLPVGIYTLREISAPAGYEVVQAVEFEITDEYKVVADTVEMIDTVVEFTVGKIDLYEKKDENGTTSEVVEIPVAGATLQILNADGDVATTKYYVDMETTPNEYLEWTTGNTDKTIRGLAAGEYVLHEESAPAGYVIADDIAFTVNQYGDIVRPNDSVPGNRLTMVDEPIRLEITKYGFDVNGEQIILPGASLELREATGEDLQGIGDIVYNVYGKKMRFDSTETAVELMGIKPGTYWLVETDVPAGYTIADPIQIVINEDMTVGQNPVTAELQNYPTEILISKKDLAYEEELAEVELQILDAAGNIAETIYYDVEDETTVTEQLKWTTDGEPRTIKGLPVGEYTLVETKAPAGYTIADPITFRIDKDGNKVIVDKETGVETDASDGITMWNDTVKVYIDKKETGTDTFVMGAAFELHEADETLEAGYKEEVALNVYDLEIAFTTGEADVTNVYKTCADGSIELTGVKPGTYYLVETKVPFGYKKQAEPTLIVVADDQTVSTEPTDVTVYNEPTEIEVLKTDKKTGKALAGATLGLYSAVFSETAGSYEATDLASIFDASQNEVEVEAWTTSTEAKVFKGLKPGYYVLTELAAPAGYTIADPVAFRLNTDGTVEIYDAENKVFNLLADADGNATIQIVVENAPIRLEISKTGFTKDGKVVPLQGAKMEIHEKTADGEIGDIIYNVYGDKMRFESATEAVALDGVVPGTYWLVELEAPEGYMLAEPIEFTINEDMTVSQNPKELIMKDCPIEVEFSKVDITNEKELAGAKLQVMDKDGKEIVKTIYGEELVWTSTNTPKKFTGLPAGEYILRETAAPEGYAIAKDVAFTITSELTVLNKVVMKDEPTKVVISKKAITGVKELEGAQLQVLDTAGKVAKTIYGEELSWTSGQTPKEFLGLPTGTYTLHEVLPPEGYAYAQDVKFEVKDDGVAAKVEMKDDTTKVTISKMDVTNNKELAGAHLILKDAQGEIVAEWTSTGKPKEMNGKLIAGATYTLTEISAPVGYDIAKDITFTVNTDGTINQVVMDDKVADGKGSVTVQKIVMQDGKYLAVDYTFYTALFADEACTQRVSSVKPLFVNGSYTTSTIFTNLQYGTYYVAETDEFGNAISEAFMIESIDIIDGKAVLTPAQATAKSTIINHVSGFDEGYYKDGEIVVNKTVLVNGVETKVTDTFYFALFTDAALTMMYDTGVVELKLKDKAKGSITFEELPYGTYYLAETDKDGNPVDADYEYTAIISSSYCSLDAENRVAEREVINSKIDIPEYGSTTTTTTTTGTTTTTSVKTGDETPVAPYAAAMALSAAVLALLTALSKKRRKKS